MTLLVPVFALIGGYLFFGESLDAAQSIAAIVILLGVAVSEIKLPKRRGVVVKVG